MTTQTENAVTNIIESQDLVHTNKVTEFELDKNELKRYLDVVIKEVRMK